MCVCVRVVGGGGDLMTKQIMFASCNSLLCLIKILTFNPLDSWLGVEGHILISFVQCGFCVGHPWLCVGGLDD